MISAPRPPSRTPPPSTGSSGAEVDHHAPRRVDVKDDRPSLRASTRAAERLVDVVAGALKGVAPVRHQHVVVSGTPERHCIVAFENVVAALAAQDPAVL